jgi:D-cysteine desulfhydrase
MRRMPVELTIPSLFRAWPALAPKLPHVSLAERPTPVGRLRELERITGAHALYVKRDDLTAHPYGGNKVRKLEFLLAAARASGADCVLTFGAAGSNHALATAIHARMLGLRSISMLVPQVNARSVRRNLLASWQAGAELHHYADEARLKADLNQELARHHAQTGRTPFVIAGGGSSALGVAGFVDAALELKAQIEAGVLPTPERIYVALGTTGTAAGLRLGLDVAGIDARLIAVRVVHPDIGNAARIARLYAETAALLREADPTFPRPTLDPASVVTRHEYFGEQYGLYTEVAVAAAAQALAAEGLELEGTYTAKAFAAFLDDACSPSSAGPALFWLTCSSRSSSALSAVDGMDAMAYRALPREFHVYFEEKLQPLDRG